MTINHKFINKKFAIYGLLLIVFVGLVYLFYPRPIVDSRHDADVFGGPTTAYTFDPKNATYTIEGQSVTLVNGVAETPSAPGSASMTTTRYFGNEAYGDIDGDNDNDVAYLITQDGGGSGLFYYAVVALRTSTGYKVTNTFLVGDRIASQSTEIHEDSQELHVNFAERKNGEPMSAEPSVGAVLLLKVTPEGVLEGLMK
ncbi:MAG: hypothetical protein K9M11_00730 [Candidatus Pacebacteria bacterium]|nr:hypothetical protein [Candidatus Paceibacterota bacterium]